MHKCASTLFSSYILKHVGGLQHVDYAGQIYSGTLADNTRLQFQETGCIYSPIRLSSNPTGAGYQMLTGPTTEHAFIRNKIALFFVRDPRDILISAYYSFGGTHGLSPVKELRERQLARMQAIQAQSLDEYVLNAATQQVQTFATLYELAHACERGVILKYEDMIDRFDLFSTQLRSQIQVSPKVVREIYRRSRPKQTEDPTSHRRSGRVGGFRGKLKAETIAALNHKLADMLQKFAYEP